MDKKDTFSCENQFWLQIMGDHARILLGSLQPKESEWIQQAGHFVTLFDTLAAQSTEYLPTAAKERFVETVSNSVQQIRTFLLQILRRLIKGSPCVNYTPAILNSMVNESEEYLRVLQQLVQHGEDNMHPIHYHLVWLPDASIHTDAINSELDTAEREMIRKMHRFLHTFDGLHLKSIQMMGLLRTGLPSIPALDRLNTEVADSLTSFSDLLIHIEKLLMQKSLLGSLSVLLINHMYRETVYYLTKLSEAANISPPSFEPALRRKE